LLEARRGLARLLLEPGIDLAVRDKALARLSDRKEQLERELAKLLPEVERGKDLDRLGPGDLAAALPRGSAFVDLVRYTHFGKGKQPTARYLAFVVRPDQTIRRVELKAARLIDDAVRGWREAIERVKDTPADAAHVARLVWEPIARELPPGTKALYIAAEGALARVPWLALPGKAAGSVLLENMAIAVVPHGPYLLEQLRYSPEHREGAESILALGSVDYGPRTSTGYAPLPGTTAELRQLTALAGKRTVLTLQGTRASWDELKEALPKARYAHLATHGFFDEKALQEERKQQERQRKEWEFRAGEITARVGLGAHSPLVFTGLALAGANDPKANGLVTGEALIELSLENLRLCVLSACQTGLGDFGPLSGETAQGLPRAFHLAGCPNVVASLWKVNDKATAALMAKFYDGLWRQGKTPLEALRQAQLTIYRHPERIADLADRGRPKFNDTVRLPADVRPGAAGRARTPTRLWAAFVLSGVGR
jgi:CHAT domain-containing protein